MITQALRNWLWKWLNLDIIVERQTMDSEAARDRERKLDARIKGLDVRITLVQEELENIINGLKVPTKQRLTQLKSGIDILSSFANELERDINHS